jgi:hypothetical protein
MMVSAALLPAYDQHIHDGQTVIASPHKIVGPESNDFMLELRKRGEPGHPVPERVQRPGA